jgi:hypothetical protein
MFCKGGRKQAALSSQLALGTVGSFDLAGEVHNAAVRARGKGRI